MPLDRAIVSCNRLEWWNAHLVGALSRTLAVTDCPMARFNQAGHAVESEIAMLVDSRDADHSVYLGSLDQLFIGIAELPMRTAIWTDYLASTNQNFLACLRLFDVVFCAQKESVKDLLKSGIARVEWLPFGFDTSLRNEPESQKIYDVGFVGSLDLPPTRAERGDILALLGKKFRLNDYRSPVFADDMMRVYNQSRVVVNIPAPGSFNMRTFEALASGALLLTRAVGNGQDDLFRDGVHFVIYRDTQDLVDKIAYYLEHERERREIAAAGMREVLAKHTYEHRAARFIEVIATASRTRSSDRRSHLEAYAAFYDYIDRADLLAKIAFDRGLPPIRRLELLARAGLKFGRSAIAFRRRGGIAPNGAAAVEAGHRHIGSA